MEAGENLPAGRTGIPSKVMSHFQLASRKLLRRPAGCEGHLTRRQAASLLGFASEFKIREFERQGRLRSVRGPMRTAFYPRPDVLALKAQLAQTQGAPGDQWTDADLIALLEHPTATGRRRTALELVTLARISIERAERVYAFWAAGAGAAPRGEAESATPHPPSAARRPLPASRGEAESGGEAGSGERRGDERLTRDSLIRELRDPNPRVRQQAFESLRAIRSPDGG
jgi:hypothetical protein